LKKTVFLFPGQGSQSVGMCHDFYQEFDFVREIFDMAQEITKINLSKLCFKGPMEELTKTVNLQPAVTAVNLSLLAAIEKENISPDFTAGHSLGEYSALCSSQIISKEDAMRLVFKRGALMHREAEKNKGAMAAIVGLAIDDVRQLVAGVQSGEGAVSVANHNAKTQIVITGSPDQVKQACAMASSKGARAIPLKVSGAWHSELIKGAEEEFTDFLDSVDFKADNNSLVFNVTADFASEPDEIRSIMAQQLCSPVRWYDSMLKLEAQEVELFVEVGPGRVLSGLSKKILPKKYHEKILNINSLKSFENFLKTAHTI